MCTKRYTRPISKDRGQWETFVPCSAKWCHFFLKLTLINGNVLHFMLPSEIWPLWSQHASYNLINRKFFHIEYFMYENLPCGFYNVIPQDGAVVLLMTADLLSCVWVMGGDWCVTASVHFKWTLWTFTTLQSRWYPPKLYLSSLGSSLSCVASGFFSWLRGVELDVVLLL